MAHVFARSHDVEYSELIGVDPPGSPSPNPPYLGHTVCARPMYPMELDTTFTPNPIIFRRRA